MSNAALLVPAFQAAGYLPRFSAAAHAQTHPFAEWICYDDASKDGTSEAAAAAGFKVITGHENRGPSFARNRLAETATSTWLHFHDADDLFTSSYLAKALAVACDDCDVVLCDSTWELEHSRERIMHWTYRNRDFVADPLAYAICNPVGVISALIRRSTFLAVGGFDESMTCWEDADLFVRLAEHGARFRCIEQTLVTSLRHDRGISRNQHHCDRCRLTFLQGYARRLPARFMPILAAEAEKVLPRLLRHGDRAAAMAALELCRNLGGNPPTTANPLLRLLKPLAPALWLVRLQHQRRTSGAHRP